MYGCICDIKIILITCYRVIIVDKTEGGYRLKNKLKKQFLGYKKAVI